MNIAPRSFDRDLTRDDAAEALALLQAEGGALVQHWLLEKPRSLGVHDG